MIKNRIEYLDIAKSVGIILMILAHIHQFIAAYPKIYHLIMSFHIPLFFIISGYLFDYKHSEFVHFSKFINKKIRTLVIPYVCFGIFFSILVYFEEPNMYKSFVRELLYYNDDIPIYHYVAGTFWFLSAFFITSILYFVIKKYCLTVIQYVVISILAIFAFLNSNLNIIRLPFSLNASLIGLLFFLFGSLERQCEKKGYFLHNIFNLNVLFTILLFFILYWLSNQNCVVIMRNSTYGNISLFLVNAIIGYIIIINISKYIINIFKLFGTTLF